MVLFLLVFALEYIRHEVYMYYLLISSCLWNVSDISFYSIFCLNPIKKTAGIIELVFEPLAKTLKGTNNYNSCTYNGIAEIMY